MLRAFTLSLGQLGDAAILRVLAKSLALTVAIFVLLGLALFGGLHTAFADLGSALGDGLAGALTVIVFVVAAWLLFRVVAIAVIGLFGDAIVAAVEARHYPAAHAVARDVGFVRSGRMALASAVRALGINLVMTPVYLALLFTAIGPAIAFFLVNGWLLGRDLGDMVASRHMDDATMRGWRKATRGQRVVLGLAVAGLFVVPLANLFAPILGAAMATHLFHGGRGGHA